ncbi:MAG: hypothetical protein MI919_02255, partial [Holophagales bacterium]|nr:hypothetical protein [Holophagales bacterium]
GTSRGIRRARIGPARRPRKLRLQSTCSLGAHFGSLTNVEYRIQVRDTVTGEVAEYLNDLGDFGSFGDIEAF